MCIHCRSLRRGIFFPMRYPASSGYGPGGKYVNGIFFQPMFGKTAGIIMPCKLTFSHILNYTVTVEKPHFVCYPLAIEKFL